MKSVMNKTQLVDKRYRDKLKKDKKSIRLNDEKHKNKKKIEKVKKTVESLIVY